MYKLNPLGRDVLITTDEVLFHAPTDHSVDARDILNNIIIAEERFIAPVICHEMYEDFIQKKNTRVTDANKQDLIDKIGNASIDVDIQEGDIVNAIEFVNNKGYQELWYRFLWKLTAEAVDIVSTVPSWLRHTAQGQQMNNPETLDQASKSKTGEMKDVKFKLDNAVQGRLNPLIASMEEYICRNKNKFPKYCKDCGGCSSSKDKNYSTGRTAWIFDAYEDVEKGKTKSYR